jgi:hypothetical protein
MGLHANMSNEQACGGMHIECQGGAHKRAWRAYEGVWGPHERAGRHVRDGASGVLPWLALLTIGDPTQHRRLVSDCDINS